LTPVPRPISLIAERAVRLLRRTGGQADSVTLARELLATVVQHEAAARRVLEAAFGGDPRLAYERGAWHLASPLLPWGRIEEDAPEPFEADRTLILVEGERQARGKPFTLRTVSALRLRAEDVIAACGGDVAGEPQGRHLRRSILETIDGAVPVIHDPPGAIRALEAWLEEELPVPISVRRLAQDRLGLEASHDLESLAAHLGLPWRRTSDPLDQADTLDGCLQHLRKRGEQLHDLRIALHKGAPPIDWTRYAFNREFLRRLPAAAGTYRFFDAQGNLLYVGKSKNLHRRLNSYFRESVRSRPERVQKLLDSLFRIEYQATISDLEAMLREAEAIAKERPSENVQRKVKTSKARSDRIGSILILEPAEPPLVLRAYLINRGRLVGRVGIGPRGGGLRRIERLLDNHYFSAPVGPTTVSGPDIDVEIVARWLAANRDQVVALDPTELRSTREVIERLRWFLHQGGPFDGDGAPIVSR
jgi:hypothetical protein